MVKVIDQPQKGKFCIFSSPQISQSTHPVTVKLVHSGMSCMLIIHTKYFSCSCTTSDFINESNLTHEIEWVVCSS